MSDRETQYTLKIDYPRGGDAAVAGATVYLCRMHDYGCASDDTRWSGVPHVSVTLDPKGGYPFFTVARADLGAPHE